MIRVLSLVVLTMLPAFAAAQPFKLAPAVAVEAEDFTVEAGWKVIQNGFGNYMVDIIGFNHIGGERLLGIDAKDSTASAYLDVQLPEDGDYRVWVRYEYPPFSNTRFRVQVEQADKTVLDAAMGAKDNPRYAFGETKARPQYDPPWGPEGLVEEVATAPGLKKGPARIRLRGAEQPQVPGRSANRNIDFVYLTRDTADAWLPHYHKQTNLYPILDAFRDSRPPRWEARFTNRGDKPADYTVHHHYNRHPWGVNEGTVASAVKPGASSDWIGLAKQDTTHYGLVQFASATKQPFDLEIRPTGTNPRQKATGAAEYGFYLPHDPKWGEPIVGQREAIQAVLDDLAKTPAIGKVPTKPLCYGGWIALGREDAVGMAYANLYKAIGLRSTPVASGPAVRKNLDAVGVPRVRSEAAMTYRNPPTAANIATAKKQFANDLAHLQWYDYGDEIGFSEWIGMMVADEVARDPKAKPADIVAGKWRAWLAKHRPTVAAKDYWLPAWGAFDATKLKPDSSAATASANPRLYVDSLIFYEDAAIAFAAAGAAAVKRELGADVWCGANYSGHPFYYPTTTMYVKWFRGGAADMGRHSEYFWQVGQLGPMVNGYFAEHFRAGMRDNPKAVLRQYTMPHAPGNSEASFLRSAFTHLAHGAKMLDFFGIGMNDSWTENYVDFRFAKERYRAVRDVTHAVGFVEDLLPDSRVVPSEVALLVSESTERWDFAGIATDQAGHAHFGPDFRKTRLVHHVERLGLWKALTFAGHSPDLVIEADLTAERLKGYKVLVVVGDCLPTDKVASVTKWVNDGGVVLATSRAGRFDSYRQPTEAWRTLFGVPGSPDAEPAETFFRVRQELPFLKPLTTASGETWKMPALASRERIAPFLGATVLATFAENGGPAFVSREVGQGRVFYTPTYPGVSYLWSATQPPIVPDRSPASHTVPTAFDEGARQLIATPLTAAKLEPRVRIDVPLIDARLIEAKGGWVLPLANYNATIGQDVTVRLKVGGKVTKVTSAYRGALPVKEEAGAWAVTVPKLGYGDVLRIE